jgi:hypothetical protein
MITHLHFDTFTQRAINTFVIFVHVQNIVSFVINVRGSLSFTTVSMKLRHRRRVHQHTHVNPIELEKTKCVKIWNYIFRLLTNDKIDSCRFTNIF